MTLVHPQGSSPLGGLSEPRERFKRSGFPGGGEQKGQRAGRTRATGQRRTGHRQPERGPGGLGTEAASGQPPSLTQGRSYGLEELKSPSHVEAPGRKPILKACGLDPSPASPCETRAPRAHPAFPPTELREKGCCSEPPRARSFVTAHRRHVVPHCCPQTCTMQVFIAVPSAHTGQLIATPPLSPSFCRTEGEGSGPPEAVGPRPPGLPAPSLQVR